jgi:RNA polymerase sigma-70 factor (ECF subfamily)
MHTPLSLDLTDEQIIDRLKAGETTRYFEVLYKRYRSKVVDKCVGLVKDRKLANELAEDIFSKVYEKLPSFKQKSSFSTWLYSITYNHCIDYLRVKKKLHYPSWNKEQEMLNIPEEEETLSDINYEKLLPVLDQLHAEEKALLFMKYQDDLSLRDISKALRISENAAKMRLKRARTRIVYLYEMKYPSAKGG